ncbi:MAG: hypothetical protein LQ349_000888 [Xanthoria aureola]|nr:MAG: hypothetical protein LQ349_000888 [Xanthoria aureola]
MIIFYDTFCVYWAGKQYGYKFAKKQITRYWPNYNPIGEKSDRELSYGEEDSEGGEELESSGEGAGAN